jgi:methionyl-tRNA formyltransferase
MQTVSTPQELTILLKSHPSSRIFFPYWSWKVPKEILKNHTCIGFHTGDVKGGSPLQNLIRLGINHSFIRMFFMNEKIDGGKDIMKFPICLKGSLEEIIINQTDCMKAMIDAYIQAN